MRSLDLSAHVAAAAQRLLLATRDAGEVKVAVALSGGIDSIVMLHLLAALRGSMPITLSALHINHGLSPNADAWEAFCHRTCGALAIPLASTRIWVGTRRSAGLEGDARDARYRALDALASARSITIVAFGQHADDQAETVLLQLLRGAGPRGLAAMPVLRISRSGAAQYWRPLLAATRAEICDYARERGLRWIEDESNSDVAFRRNYLRAKVTPALDAGFPDFRLVLSRAATRAAEISALLDDVAQTDLAAAGGDRGLAVAAIRAMGALRAANMLQHLIRSGGLEVPRSERIAEFIRQVIEGGADRHPALILSADYALRADRGRVNIVATVGPFEVTWQAQDVLQLPHGRLVFERTTGTGIRASSIPAGGLCVRPRGTGERLRIDACRPQRTVKKLMQEAGIPASLRAGWPMIDSGGRIVAIPGIGVSVDWQAAVNESGWTVKWHPLTRMSAQT